MFPYLTSAASWAASGSGATGDSTHLGIKILTLDRHVWAWIIGGTFAFLAIVISTIEMVMHCRYSNDAKLRKHTLRILLMVPLYAINAFFGLYLKESVELWDLAREAYEAVVIYSFYQFLVEYLGGSKRLVYLATSQDPEMDWYRERYRQQQERLAHRVSATTSGAADVGALPQVGYVPPVAAASSSSLTLPGEEAPAASSKLAPSSSVAAGSSAPITVGRRRKTTVSAASASAAVAAASTATAASAAAPAAAAATAAETDADATVSIRGGARRRGQVEFKKELKAAAAGDAVGLLSPSADADAATPADAAAAAFAPAVSSSSAAASAGLAADAPASTSINGLTLDITPLPSYAVFSTSTSSGSSGHHQQQQQQYIAPAGTGTAAAAAAAAAPAAGGSGLLLAAPPPMTESEAHPKEHHHIFPFNMLFKKPVSAERFVVLTRFGALQYVPVQITLCTLAFILHLSGVEPAWSLGNPHPYFITIINFSQLWAMYGLFWFYHGYHAQLEPCRPLAKALCIKGIVFFTFWQSVLISIWSYFYPVDCVEHPGPHSDLPQCSDDQYSTAQRARTLQDFIICIEMLIFAILHMYVFSWREFKLRHGRDDRTLFRRFVTFFNPHDMVRDMRRNIKPDTLRYVAVDGFVDADTVAAAAAAAAADDGVATLPAGAATQREDEEEDGKLIQDGASDSAV